jgi:hypothetical protein
MNSFLGMGKTFKNQWRRLGKPLAEKLRIITRLTTAPPANYNSRPSSVVM